MSETDHGARLGRVEIEVQALTVGFTDLKADVKGLGSILGRIERGIEVAQDRTAEREQHSRPSVVAVVSILITMISIIVGGAWLISGSLSRMDERSDWVRKDLERIERRQWDNLPRLNQVGRPQVAETPAIGQTRPPE